jgi:hypothetical protein
MQLAWRDTHALGWISQQAFPLLHSFTARCFDQVLSHVIHYVFPRLRYYYLIWLVNAVDAIGSDKVTFGASFHETSQDIRTFNTYGVFVLTGLWAENPKQRLRMPRPFGMAMH